MPILAFYYYLRFTACPPSTVQENGKCYHYSNVKLPYNKVRKYCGDLHWGSRGKLMEPDISSNHLLWAMRFPYVVLNIFAFCSKTCKFKVEYV